SPGQLIVTIGGSALLWIVLGAGCLLVGSTGGIGIPTADQLPWRLESVLLASLIGAALGAAGVVYQAILRNPLADPYLLGVSSGASLFAYLWQFRFAASVAAVSVGFTGRVLSPQTFAFVGAAISVMVVFALASQRGRIEPITLLLVGVIVNAVNGALFLLINALYKDHPGSGGALNFLVGGIQTTLTVRDKAEAAAIIGAGWLALMALSGQLGVASLSESEAESLGVRIHRLRWVSLILASLITASAVAISGPIGFVGLVCPHVGRLLVGGDTRRLLPVATGLGAGLLAVADAASRCLAGEGYARTLLPVGVLTGLLGGPFFLVLLWQSRRRLGAEVSR
ncbi:MAG TPA: iron ABC transporter permease, partial [Tepidisphaeraceae bacterium]|nr:iron ABC transporter permease [Tepidisphaeraceae bacterium]